MFSPTSKALIVVLVAAAVCLEVGWSKKPQDKKNAGGGDKGGDKKKNKSGNGISMSCLQYL